VKQHSLASVPRAVYFAVGLALLAGCPEQTQTDTPAPNAPCREVGQRCEVSPGKLGSCVVIDTCRSGNCFVCQSQH
jgi:hypothetical protein